jgi:hypothetical protein
MRQVSPAKTRKAMRKLAAAVDRAEADGSTGLTPWEAEFASSVATRLETFGSAFADPQKGNLEEALSVAQAQVLRQMGRPKANPSQPARSGLQTRKPLKPGKGWGRPTPADPDTAETGD